MKINGVLTATTILTIVPVPFRFHDERPGDSLIFFPLIGTLIGLGAATFSWLGAAVLGWPEASAMLCIAFTTLLTGGLHLDGLADTFDSFGGRSVARRLEIMKDSRSGAFGVTALAICLLWKFSCITRISGAGAHLELILPFCISRTMQTALVIWLPPARPESSVKILMESTTPSNFWKACLLAAPICIAVGGLGGLAWIPPAFAITSLFAVFFKSRFGGLTGDLLGASSELVEVAVLFGIAVVC